MSAVITDTPGDDYERFGVGRVTGVPASSDPSEHPELSRSRTHEPFSKTPDLE